MTTTVTLNLDFDLACELHLAVLDRQRKVAQHLRSPNTTVQRIAELQMERLAALDQYLSAELAPLNYR